MNQNCTQNFRLILASGSPRRRELLTQMGYTFEIIVPDVDENVSGHAREVVGILSRRKAEAVAQGEERGIVIASDTLVSLNGAALGKPQDAADAHRMLRMLSGETHEVFTGVTIIDAASGKTETQVVRTGVIFRALSDGEIDAYIATGEPMDKTSGRIWHTEELIKKGWMDENGRWKTHNGMPSEAYDKAGAYAIQGGAHGFVEGFEGSYENVIGFPVDEIREMLKHFI